ncbi:hypothetical protein SRHO_G00274710 [Serrasalmus rhombeus]
MGLRQAPRGPTAFSLFRLRFQRPLLKTAAVAHGNPPADASIKSGLKTLRWVEKPFRGDKINSCRHFRSARYLLNSWFVVGVSFLH